MEKSFGDSDCSDDDNGEDDNDEDGEDSEDEEEEFDEDCSQSKTQPGSESGSNCSSEAEDEEGDEGGEEYPFNTNYKLKKDTGGRHAVWIEDSVEVSLEEHEEICGCDLDAPDSIHFSIVVHDDSDADSVIADLDIDD
jgi:hypothetical protein